MPIEIKVGGPHLTIHHGHGVWISEPDGSVIQPSQKGLFFRDTRLISGWRSTAGGKPWILLNSANEAYCVARLVLTNPKLHAACGELQQRTLGLDISREIGEGIHEDLDLSNYGKKTVHFNFEIDITSDFADFFEVKGDETIERSGISTVWSQEEQSLSHSYCHDGFSRGITIRVCNGGSRPAFANGRIAFPISLDAGARWHVCLLYEFVDRGQRFSAPAACHRAGVNCEKSQKLQEECRKVAGLHSSRADLERIGRQAIEDMVALRLSVPDTSGKPIVAAGVPWFLSLFGRDSIIASLQYEIIDPQVSFGVLEQLGALQARGIDNYRDAEPGKIPHELRHGELAFFGKIPHTPYYGTADATPLYLILLHSAWKRTGDNELIHKHLGIAERCLQWIDEYGDRDGDGFQEYQTRSSAGYENQSWKDAGDAILYPDGTCVKGPKALCELQGYVFDAWLRMAEMFGALGASQRASVLRRKAQDLYQRFNEKFWDEETGFYALTLDGDKRPVMTVASNPGHCLWSGIVPRDRARRVVDRLIQPDMWSGWGIRTLSARHPAFNPFSYENGSVWPHDNGIIALGMKRYGFTREAGEVTRAICEAASFFVSDRLPELFAGIDRDTVCFPLRYLGANVPQAWATGTIFALIQALIGFQPDAPRHRLGLDPTLPDWLAELEIRNLSLGADRIDLRFWRAGGTTRFEVTRGNPAIVTQCPIGVPADEMREQSMA